VKCSEIFENWNLPAQAARIEPFTLRLREGASAIDAGARLPNINDDFYGKAPDLGASEFGAPAALYGPRPK